MSGNGNGRQKTNGVCQLGKGHRLSSFGTSALVNTAATAVAIFCGLFKMTENFTSYFIVGGFSISAIFSAAFFRHFFFKLWYDSLITMTKIFKKR